jgi:tetratricopeptide (TPR) repeat protein
MGDALGAMGDLARAEAAFERALAPGPDSAPVLALYAGWASTFGKPAEGVVAAARAIRLGLDTDGWALGRYRSAHFIVGLYEDALRFGELKPRELWGPCDFVMRAATLAALGRAGEARAAVADALARHPTVTIEGYTILDHVWSEAERERLTETMREAGFPACARQEEVARSEVGAMRRRLPERVTL